MTTDIEAIVPESDDADVILRFNSDGPEHLARCDSCPAGVKFRRSASGAAFVWLERYGMDVDTLLGTSEAGLPLCPNGHGEMALEDEQLPASEAISDVAERLKANPPRLPFPAEPFNYEGVLHAIFEKRHEIADLSRDYDRKKESASKAKKALDEANEELGSMLDEYERRETDRLHELERQALQAEAGHPDGTNLVRCLWDERNQEDPCPLCSGSVVASLIARHVGEIAVRDSEAHLDQVVQLREAMDIDATEDALAHVAIVPRNVIVKWTPADRAAVRAFGIHGGDRPAILGTAHIAGDFVTEHETPFQVCQVCGIVILKVSEGEPIENYPPYNVGALVGTDCIGTRADGNHYPEKKKTRKAR